MSDNPRPHMEPSVSVAYDWLAANGVDEWLPNNPHITVAAGKLTYEAHVWKGPRGWDFANIVYSEGLNPYRAVTEHRTVPLVAPLTDEVRTAIRASGGQLVEIRDDVDPAQVVAELVEAIRLTVEYLGTDTLPAKPGWAWYDALVKHAPDVAAGFARPSELDRRPA